MVKDLMNDYIMLPFNKNKFIRWVGENELEVIEKKNVHIPNPKFAERLKKEGIC